MVSRGALSLVNFALVPSGVGEELQVIKLGFEDGSGPPEALLAQPKPRRGRGAPKPPLKELGPDPQSGKPLVVKDGRFGPYVTDGETNASLRRGDDVDGLSLERALELLAERRAKGPAQPRSRTRSRR